MSIDEDAWSKGDITHWLLCVCGHEMKAAFKEGAKYKVYDCKSGVYEFVLSLERLSN